MTCPLFVHQRNIYILRFPLILKTAFFLDALGLGVALVIADPNLMHTAVLKSMAEHLLKPPKNREGTKMSSTFLNDENKGDIVIYQSESGETKIDVRFQDETVWLTQAQMEELFQSSNANVVEHIKNIYSEGELDASSTCRKFRQVRREGNRNVERERLSCTSCRSRKRVRRYRPRTPPLSRGGCLCRPPCCGA